MTEVSFADLLVRHGIGEEDIRELPEVKIWAAGDPACAVLLDLAGNLEALATELDDFMRFAPADGFARWKAKRSPVFPLWDNRVYRRRLLVIASLVIVVTGGVFFARHQRHSSETAVAPAAGSTQELVPPGRNTAMLTLAAGRSVLLDTVPSGELPREANTRLFKTDSDQISYQPIRGIAGSINPGASEPGYNTLQTPRSGQYRLTLPDGSRVWLNNETSLRYPTAFPGKERTVELKGEAYFEIVRDISRPFKVKFKDATIQVLGTAFDVIAYPEEAGGKTTVLTGKVQVRTPEGVVVLKLDEQAREDSAGKLTVMKNVPAEDVAAWRNGYFYFGRTTLNAVMLQLARWYDVTIVNQAKPRVVEFDGKIDRKITLNELLNRFEKNNIHCRLQGRKLIVLPD